MSKRRTVGTIPAAFLLVIALLPNTAVADYVSTFTFNTTPLIGHPAGPFSLDFQFNDGSFPNDSNNSASVTLLNLGGGQTVGSGTSVGGVTGDFSAAVLF